MESVIKINNLSYYYGAVQALSSVDLEVNSGEIVSIIGSNGAGKTTLLRSISGLLDKKGMTGSILFLEKDISNLKPDKISKSGIIQCLEGRHIFSNLTVEENLYIGSFQRNDFDNIRKDLEEMYIVFPRLKERRNQLGGTLSGGEQQMLALARALMSKPKLLLLDEPSLGLAPKIINEVYEMIEKIRKRGISILLVEQNSRKALSVSDRTYILELGKIVQQGNSKDLINSLDIKKRYLGIE